MQLIISASNQVLVRRGNQLAVLGEGQVRTALSRALNHEGDKGRTQVKRALVKPICSRGITTARMSATAQVLTTTCMLDCLVSGA
jgi:hypothetical protein